MRSEVRFSRLFFYHRESIHIRTSFEPPYDSMRMQESISLETNTCGKQKKDNLTPSSKTSGAVQLMVSGGARALFSSSCCSNKMRQSKLKEIDAVCVRQSYRTCWSGCSYSLCDWDSSASASELVWQARHKVKYIYELIFELVMM